MASDCIRTVYGAGYRFAVPPDQNSEELPKPSSLSAAINQ
jgi:DNA-binding winged helix-turn-helix (wHTH) protein